jgi:hypothetical protein
LSKLRVKYLGDRDGRGGMGIGIGIGIGGRVRVRVRIRVIDGVIGIVKGDG